MRRVSAQTSPRASAARFCALVCSPFPLTRSSTLSHTNNNPKAYRAAPDRPWLELGWRELELEVSSSRGAAAASSSSSAQVLLRASVAELAELWRRRLEVRNTT